MKLLRLLFGLLFLLLLLAGGGLYASDSIARKAITAGGTLALGVETRLDSVSIGLLSGQLSLSGLEIDNPEGYSEKPFLSMAEAEFDVDLPTLLADRVVASLLSLKGLHLSLEAKGTKTNYDVLLGALGGPGGEPSAEESPSAEADGAKTFAIDRIVLEDIQITLDLGSSLLSGGGTIDVPRIELTDLASKEMTFTELTSLILRTLLEHAAASGQDFFPPDLLDRMRGSLNGFANLEGIGDVQGLEDIQDLRDNLERAGEDAKGAIRGLLGKD